MKKFDVVVSGPENIRIEADEVSVSADGSLRFWSRARANEGTDGCVACFALGWFYWLQVK